MPQKAPIWLAVEKLTERVNFLESKVNVVNTPAEVNPEVVPSVRVPDYPIPAEYKDIVHLTFNKSFEIRLEPMTDTPAFLFTVVVPKKYSKANSGEDLRAKVITYSDGVSGVRLWADKVFNNFDPDTQALIIQDRPFVNSPI